MVSCGVAASVQMVHLLHPCKLLQDMADASQPRFGELAGTSVKTGAEEALSAFPSSDNTSRCCATIAGTSLGDKLMHLAPAQYAVHVEEAVLRVVRELTGASAWALTAETPLMEAGVDSLAAMELSSRLRAVTGVALSATVVFEQPTPRAIAAQVLEETCQDRASSTVPIERHTRV